MAGLGAFPFFPPGGSDPFSRRGPDRIQITKGLIPIDNEKRVDWDAIRAEYIGGGISQRKLAEKHGVSPDALMQKANRENWKKYRDKAISKSIARSQQKTANAIADNATIAANIRRKGLLLIERLMDDFAENHTATEHRENQQGKTDIKRLRDLTAAYKDLTGDIVQGQNDSALLQSLIDLERGRE